MRSHVYYYTHIGAPWDGSTALFATDPGHWLPAPARASDLGCLVELRADGVLPPQLAVQLADVVVGTPLRPGSGLVRSVSWHAQRADRLFPVLTGDLELCPLPGGGCQLSLTATYRPPLSVVGEGADRLLGHRVAEACVRAFVLGVATNLEPATLQACT